MTNSFANFWFDAVLPNTDVPGMHDTVRKTFQVIEETVQSKIEDGDSRLFLVVVVRSSSCEDSSTLRRSNNIFLRCSSPALCSARTKDTLGPRGVMRVGLQLYHRFAQQKNNKPQIYTCHPHTACHTV